MYTKEELEEIRTALPKGGFSLVAEKLPGTTPDAVKMVLTYPERFRPEVFDAVVEVMEEYKTRVKNQKKKVMRAIK